MCATMRTPHAALAALALAAGACHDVAPPPIAQDPAPPAAHTPARPVANLDVIWRGSSAAELPPSARAPADTAIAIARNSDVGLEGIDARTHARRWARACSDMANGTPCMGRLERSGDVAVYAGTLWYKGPESEGAFAIDVPTGRELWRVQTGLDDELSTKLAIAGDHAYVMAATNVVALDLATGARAWERHTAPRDMMPSRGRQLAAGDGVVAFADGDGAVHLTDPRTGVDRARIPWSGTVGDLVIRDGVLYVVPMWSDGPEAIAAYDVATGRERWRHDETEAWAVPPVFIDDDALYLRRSADRTRAQNDEGTELVALDRATGAIVWERALGHVTSLRAVAAAGEPATLVATTGRETLVFARQASPAAAADVTITGTVWLDGLSGPLDGLRVQVGGVTALTDAAGAFTARVRGHGAIEIRLLDLPPLTAAAASAGAAPIVADPDFVNVDHLATEYRAKLVVHAVSPWPPD
jgi:outer membrane protein assembly factor BamB